MKFGFSTNLFTSISLDSALRQIALHGFRYVEILADAPHAELAVTKPSEYDILKKQLDDHDLKACNVNANTVRCLGSGRADDFSAFTPSFFEANPMQRRKRIDYSRRAIRLCKVIDSPVCTIATSPLPEGKSRTAAMALLHDALYELIDYADELGVKLAVEYEPGLLIDSYPRLAELLKVHSLLHANLDVGHSALCGEDPVEVIGKLGNRIANVHFEDIAGNTHYHLPPGEGEMDLAGILSALESISYKGVVVFELYSCQNRPAEAIKKAASYVRSLGAK